MYNCCIVYYIILRILRKLAKIFIKVLSKLQENNKTSPICK